MCWITKNVREFSMKNLRNVQITQDVLSLIFRYHMFEYVDIENWLFGNKSRLIFFLLIAFCHPRATDRVSRMIEKIFHTIYGPLVTETNLEWPSNEVVFLLIIFSPIEIRHRNRNAVVSIYVSLADFRLTKLIGFFRFLDLEKNCVGVQFFYCPKWAHSSG